MHERVDRLKVSIDWTNEFLSIQVNKYHIIGVCVKNEWVRDGVEWSLISVDHSIFLLFFPDFIWKGYVSKQCILWSSGGHELSFDKWRGVDEGQ